MSFAFTAVGRREEVIGQLNGAVAAGDDGFNAAGADLAALIARHLGESDPGAWAEGFSYRYVVKASGHSSRSGTPFSLNVTVEPHLVADRGTVT